MTKFKIGDRVRVTDKRRGCGNESDAVNAPNHYTSVVPGIECIDVAKHFPFAEGNIIKYTWRARHKGSYVENMRKVIKNAEFAIAKYEEEESGA